MLENYFCGKNVLHDNSEMLIIMVVT